MTIAGNIYRFLANLFKIAARDGALQGCDVSKWQDANSTPQGIDFVKMRAAGADFVYIKASQANWSDEDFQTNWTAAKAAGLKRGAYHFLTWAVSVETQAEYFWSLLKDDPGELAPACDFEWNPGATTPSNALELLARFLGRLESLSGITPVVYTSAGFWPAAETNPKWARYPLWVAHYTSGEPLIPAPWAGQGYAIHQYSSHGDGLVYGVESLNIDLDRAGSDWPRVLVSNVGGNMWKDNAIGLYTKSATWTNPAFDFIVGYAGGDWSERGVNNWVLEPNPALKPIEEKTHGEGKPFLALWDFDVSYYSLSQIMGDDVHWPSEAADYPLQALIGALSARDVDGLIIRVMNNRNRLGRVESQAYIAYAAGRFVERANRWLYQTKGLDKWSFVLTSDDFLRIDGKQEDFYRWLRNWYLGIEQEAVRPLDAGAWPQATDKIRAVPTSLGWKFWYHYNAATLDMMIFNGKPADLRAFLGYEVEPPADTVPPTVPANLAAQVAPGTVALSWSASSDNVGVVCYHVYRNGVMIGSPVAPGYTDSGLAASDYLYSVSAWDAAGNESARAELAVTVPGEPCDLNELILRVAALEGRVTALENKLAAARVVFD